MIRNMAKALIKTKEVSVRHTDMGSVVQMTWMNKNAMHV